MAFVVILCGHSIWAQSTDILRIEYLNIPQNNTGIKTQRYKGLFNLPIKLNEKKDYLIMGMEYNRFDMGYSEDFPFNKKELIRFHVIDMNVGFITKWNENWNLVTILTPRMASNFISGTVTDDFFMNATATLWKEKPDAEKPYRIVLGLTYNSTTGLPVPLPLINYYCRFHPNWAFTLGILSSDLKYYVAKMHVFVIAIFLDHYLIYLKNIIRFGDG